MAESLYGPIVSGRVLELAIEATVDRWIGEYLEELAHQQGQPNNPLAPFASYNVRPKGEHWPEDQIPAIIIVNAGLEKEPAHDGDGLYEAEWRIGCVIIASGQDEGNARQNAEDYAACVRTLLVHRRGELGVSHVRWVAETYDEAAAESGRTLSGAVVEYVMTMPAVLDRSRGPSPASVPDPSRPGSALQHVEHPHLDVKILDPAGRA